MRSIYQKPTLRQVNNPVQDAYRRYTIKVGVPANNPSRSGGSKLAERMWDGDLTGFAKTETIGWGPTEQFLQRLMAA